MTTKKQTEKNVNKSEKKNNNKLSEKKRIKTLPNLKRKSKQ